MLRGLLIAGLFQLHHLGHSFFFLHLSIGCKHMQRSSKIIPCSYSTLSFGGSPILRKPHMMPALFRLLWYHCRFHSIILASSLFSRSYQTPLLRMNSIIYAIFPHEHISQGLLDVLDHWLSSFATTPSLCRLGTLLRLALVFDGSGATEMMARSSGYLKMGVNYECLMQKNKEQNLTTVDWGCRTCWPIKTLDLGYQGNSCRILSIPPNDMFEVSNKTHVTLIVHWISKRLLSISKYLHSSWYISMF